MAVAVGPKGIPDDVLTGSLSRVARESGRTESEVRAAFEGRDYRIMMPDEFLRLLDELKDKVLGGTATLPFVQPRFRVEPVAIKLNTIPTQGGLQVSLIIPDAIPLPAEACKPDQIV